MENQLEFDQGTLALRGWENEALEKVLGSNPFCWDPRINAHRCDAMYYAAIAGSLVRHAWE